jgi:hypothetical protein
VPVAAATAPLTGLPIDDATAVKLFRPALAVKIDNSVDAMPQEGLNQALVDGAQYLKDLAEASDDNNRSVERAQLAYDRAVAARQDEIRLAKPKASPMITEAQHGRKGVAIMTQAAASIPAVAEGREAYLERNKSFLHNPLPNGG